MQDVISKVTWNSIQHYGDRATVKFYEFLKNRIFRAPYCTNCKRKWFPPRIYCPRCGQEMVRWEEMSHTGKIYAFTQQERSLRFGKPDVIGIVELDSGERLLTKINGKFEELKIGMKVKLEFLDIDDNITLHTFTPVE